MSAQIQWKCCGCGASAPGRRKTCDCPTQVVYQPGGASAWCVPDSFIRRLKARYARQSLKQQLAFAEGRVLELTAENARLRAQLIPTTSGGR